MNVHIGAPVRCNEDDRLLTGRGRFSDDVGLPGQAYGALDVPSGADARTGAELVEIRYDILPAVTDIARASFPADRQAQDGDI